MSLTRAGSICVAAVAMLIAGCGVLLTPHYRLERAQREIHAGQWQDAAVDLRIVVQKQPNNAQAWLLLTRVTLDVGDLAGASSAMAHALAAGAKGPDVDHLRARVWVEGGQPQQLLDALAQHTIRLAEPDRTIESARALLLLRQPDAALAQLQPLVAAQPDLWEAQDLIAEALAGQGKFPQALQQLDATLQRDPKASEPPLVKGLLLQQQGQYAAAQEALTLALQRMRPAEPMAHRVRALIALTQVRLSLGDIKAAAGSAATVEKLQPQSPAAALLDARLKIARKDLQGGVAELERIVAAAPGYDEARLLLGAALLQRGDLQQAQQQLQQLVENAPDDLQVRKLLAEVQLKLGQPQAAFNALTPALATAALDPQLLSLYGQAESATGDKQALIAALQREQAQHPTDQTVLLNLGVAYLAAGQAQQALDVLQKTADNGNPLRDQMLIAALMAARKPEAALARVQALLAQRPDDPAALELEGDVQAYLKQPAAAEAAYARVQQLRPSAKVAASLFRVRLMAHTPQPQQPLEQWLAREPKSWPIRELLGEYYLGAGSSPDRAAQEFKAVIAGQPNDVVALNNLAWALNLTGDPGAVAIAQRAYRLAPNAPAVEDTLGWVLTRNGQAAGAIDYLRRAAKLNPSDPNVAYHLAYALSKTGQAAEARQILAKILASGQAFDSRAEAQQLLHSVQG